jgi:hypothetical protein
MDGDRNVIADVPSAAISHRYSGGIEKAPFHRPFSPGLPLSASRFENSCCRFILATALRAMRA